jgi:ketosteroid isomerase-like protein
MSDVTDPAKLPGVFADAFNAADAEAIEHLFEAGAVFVTEPGQLVSGDARRAATGDFLKLGVPISITLRHCYVSTDIALLIGDFVIHGTGTDGNPVHIEGTATDVARRGADGCWRYVIDNPPGADR